MLFNSYSFIFLFLPVILVGFFQLGRIHHAYAAAWLALASLFFYGYWNPAYIGLLLGISFFTFTRIAFLVDTYQGKVKEYNFIHYPRKWHIDVVTGGSSTPHAVHGDRPVRQLQSVPYLSGPNRSLRWISNGCGRPQ